MALDQLSTAFAAAIAVGAEDMSMAAHGEDAQSCTRRPKREHLGRRKQAALDILRVRRVCLSLLASLSKLTASARKRLYFAVGRVGQ